MSHRLTALSSFLVVAVALTGCAGFTGSNTITPKVIATSPMSGAINSPDSRHVTATFGITMDSSTINSGSFLVKAGGTLLPGVVSYSGVTATIFLDAPMPANTLITATLTTALKDNTATRIAHAYVWSFRTTATPDTTPPTVVTLDPGDTSMGVVRNKVIVAVFSENILASSVDTSDFSVSGPAGAISGTIEVIDKTIQFTPSVTLDATTAYTVTIGTGVSDWSDNFLATAKSWTFTTGA